LVGGPRGRSGDDGSRDELAGPDVFSDAPLFTRAESIQQTKSAPRKEIISETVSRDQCMP
jgi:hypothetical protein